MKMIGNVCIFLTVALFVTAAVMIVITRWYINLCKQWNEEADRISQLEADNALLLDDKRGLIVSNEKLEAENRELYDDNIKLMAAIKELKAINNELMNNEAVQEEPELQASESNESALSSQSDDVLQTDATKLKERLPEGHTNVISGMPYTTITNKKSEQWALQLQAFTGKYGIRSYFDGDRIYFLAAMGSAYGRTIGDTFRVTLRCGTVMYVMLGEFKDDGTDPNFFGHPTTHADGYDVTCVLEFIYDAEHINSKALQAGNFCNIECFGGLHGYGGDIARIEYLGRKWEP